MCLLPGSPLIGGRISMCEPSHEQRVQRVIEAAKREDAPSPTEADRGDLIYRVCLGCWQVLEARADGHEIKMRRETPASDWPIIRARLNRQWRNRNS